MEQATGVEPALFVWETKVLPFAATQNNMVLKRKIRISRNTCRFVPMQNNMGPKPQMHRFR